MTNINIQNETNISIDEILDTVKGLIKLGLTVYTVFDFQEYQVEVHRNNNKYNFKFSLKG